MKCAYCGSVITAEAELCSNCGEDTQPLVPAKAADTAKPVPQGVFRSTRSEAV